MVPYQEARQPRIAPLRLEQFLLSRRLGRKFHRSALVSDVRIDDELVEAQFDADRPLGAAVDDRCLKGLLKSKLDAVGHVASGAPSARAALDEGSNIAQLG